MLRDRVGPLRRRGRRVSGDDVEGVAAVLLSHLHHDHLDLPSLRRLDPAVRVVVPRGGAPIVRLAGCRDVVEVVPGDVLDLLGVRLEVVAARHPGNRARSSCHAPAVGHLLVPSGARRGLYLAGDTGRQPATEASLRGRVGVAVLPVGGWGPTLGPEHLDPVAAAEVAVDLGASLAVPYHWGTLLSPGAALLRPDITVRAGARFAAAVRAHPGGSDVAVPGPGEQLDLRAWWRD